MGLTNAYLVSVGKVPEFFAQLKDGQAPNQLSQQLVKDWGFSSSNDRAFIPLLKALGFLSADGKPTSRYMEYRDSSRSKAVLGEALKDAYADLFLIKSNPSDSDKDAIKGKFKSYHNVSDNVAGLMTKTFYSILSIADISSKKNSPPIPPEPTEEKIDTGNDLNKERSAGISTGLHYNIQIHLPPTKDIEVYNAIFKSLRAHLIDE